MPSMNEAFGHVRQINTVDKEFNGFLTIFAKLPPKTQTQVLAEVARLKEQFGKDKEGFFEEVRALAEMYGALDQSARTWSTDANNHTFKLGEISSALSDLQKGKQSGNTIH